LKGFISILKVTINLESFRVDSSSQNTVESEHLQLQEMNSILLKQIFVYLNKLENKCKDTKNKRC